MTLIFNKRWDILVFMNSDTSKVQEFCEARDWDQYHNPKELSIGLITEASELLEKFRFLTEDQVNEKMRDPEFRDQVGDELADAYFFVLRFAQMNGFELSEVLETKLVKNDRKYPVERSKGSNKKYTEL